MSPVMEVKSMSFDAFDLANFVFGYPVHSYMHTGGLVTRNDDGLVLEIPAPGLKKSDFAIEIENRVLSVATQHKADKLYQRKFKKSWHLDDDVDVQNISASYEDGVLRLLLPFADGKKHSRTIVQIK